MKPEEIPPINSIVYGIRLSDNFICHGRLITIAAEIDKLQFRVAVEKDTTINCDFVALTSLKLIEEITIYFTKRYEKTNEKVRQYASEHPILKSSESF